MSMFVEDSELKIGGEREFVDEIKLNRVLSDYFVNRFHCNGQLSN